MFVGTISGNIIGTLYYLAYQVIGLYIAFNLIKSEKAVLKALIGSVIGSIGIHWCPIIFSFMLDFTAASHICGLILFAVIGAALVFYNKKKPAAINKNAVKKTAKAYDKNHKKSNVKKSDVKQNDTAKNQKSSSETGRVKDSIKNYPVLICAVPLFIFFCMMLWNHTLLPNDNGGYSTGQCGYGDMNMHLGFITSIANQHTFPPHYSILPDAKLSYPFLSDTISSSIYIWGSSLRYAYMLPMWFAILQVMGGMYLFAESFLKNKWKAFLAYVLFFFNGGLGFIYFLNGYQTFSDLMNGFYKTPTNLVDVGIRWTNTIVDMLLPQRATLFGWAILFPILILLRKAWTERNGRYFIIVGILGGALPMVHTHSFLALGLISFGWLVADVANRSGIFAWTEDGGEKTGKTAKIILAAICIGGIAVLSVISSIQRSSQTGIEPKLLMAAGILGIAAIFGIGVYFLLKNSKEDRNEVIKNWGRLLLIVVIIAFPQLIYWTFGQVSEGEMLRGHFNWSNTGDTANSYIFYYLMNLGVVAIIFIPAWIMSRKREIAHVFPSLIIWFLCEFIVFQPNVYDNNKLLLAAYMIICCFVAGYICDMLTLLFGGRNPKTGVIKNIAKYVVTAVLVFVCSISAVLTMAREYYSGTPASWYELYDKEMVDACKFIEENTEATDTILTANNHNNAVASLTGRNIVCGSSTFLYFHGFDTYEREDDVAKMYSDPVNSDTLFRQYSVDFILVGNNEYSFVTDKGYTLSEQALYDKFPCVYGTDNVRIYQVR